MSPRTLSVLMAFASAIPAGAQFSYPSSASTRLYLGHFIDGGSPEQKWRTTVIFTNPNPNAAAPVRVSFHGDAGQPLPLDFGQGPSPTLDLTVPAGGAKTLTTTGASPVLASGWAIVETPDEPATAPATPVTASVLYRAELAGNRFWDVATNGSGSTFFYSSFANKDLGVALANPNRSETVHLQIRARDEAGQSLGGPWAVNLQPLGHTAFNLSGPPTNLASFSGSIQISSSDDPPLPFVAVTLNYRDPVLTPLPPGETVSPAPPDRRPRDVAIRVRQAGVAVLAETDPYMLGQSPATIAEFLGRIGLAVDTDVPLRASYSSTDHSVHLSAGMIEALGTDEAALAFLIAHMSARGVLQAFGVPSAGPYASDPDGLADYAAVVTLLKGGFDPNGIGDFFGRLLNATQQGLSVDSALRNSFAIPDGLPLRLAKAAANLKTACGATGGMQQICQSARKYWHPHNPADLP